MSKNLQRIKFSKLNNDLPSVDRDNGIIRGVSIITGNREASGHGTFVDETMVDQVVEFGEESDRGPGLKARFDHPNACFRSIGTAVGRFRNFRKEGLKAKADLHLLDAASSSPEGDLRTHILDLAEEDPDIFATSIVFTQDEPEMFETEDFPLKNEDDPFFLPHARIANLHACDIVDEGAANDGLFGRPDYLAEQAEKWGKEHPEVLTSVLDYYFKTNGIDIEKLKQLSMSEVKTKEETKNMLVSAVEKVQSLTTKFFGAEEEEATEGAPEPTNTEETPEASTDETVADVAAEPVAEEETTEEDVTEEPTAETEESEEDVVEEPEAESEEVASLKAEKEALESDYNALKDELESLKGEIAELSKVKLGEPLAISGTDNVQNPEEGSHKETFSEKKTREKEERLARQMEARDAEIKRQFGDGAFGIYN